MLTPKMSLRRNNVLGAYKSIIEQLYERPNDCTSSGVIQVRAGQLRIVQYVFPIWSIICTILKIVRALANM